MLNAPASVPNVSLFGCDTLILVKQKAAPKGSLKGTIDHFSGLIYQFGSTTSQRKLSSAWLGFPDTTTLFLFTPIIAIVSGFTPGSSLVCTLYQPANLGG
jgi:hypothetical protein